MAQSTREFVCNSTYYSIHPYKENTNDATIPWRDAVSNHSDGAILNKTGALISSVKFDLGENAKAVN